MKLLPTLATLSLLAAAGAAQAADPNLARNLAATCANCHGTNGKAVAGSGADALAGNEKAKTLQKLADSRVAPSRRRSCTRSPRAIRTSNWI